MASGSADSGLISHTPTITHKKEDLFITEYLSDNDKKWLVYTLNEKIVPKMRFISMDSRPSSTPESHLSYTRRSQDSN